jgi:hypothetical protein
MEILVKKTRIYGIAIPGRLCPACGRALKPAVGKKAIGGIFVLGSSVSQLREVTHGR